MSTQAEVADAGARGRLVVHDRVFRRIAERAAATVAGRTGQATVWERLGGQRLPHASARVVGRHVRVEVTVGADGGRVLPDLAGAVRDAVARDVGGLTGFTVDRVDVRVAAVAPYRPAPEAEPLPGASRPVAPGVARKAGLLVALLLVGLGAAAIYDALVQGGVIDGQRLVEPLLERLDGLEPQSWMVPAGIAVAVAGLALIVAALWPRPRRSLPVSARTGVFATRGAVEELTVDSAAGHGGVLDASARARPRGVAVRVVTDGEPETPAEVRENVTTRLARLDQVPRVRVGARRKEER
ncbi:DUF6286 domain-containing Asp23/Gls24 family envelope stress response protein [Jiangella endophytica]|uniref:DUF6286 domain-containing Asp23/Gls24 family envelope stress response protein n=1 Tax=Jiangella endophytica TaxID=1623398 RepID=UPI000E34B73A|nr:DUF6286 domain-containing Asp23/Gls24 family envelope stress response protein [Jiangella endophytica]